MKINKKKIIIFINKFKIFKIIILIINNRETETTIVSIEMAHSIMQKDIILLKMK